MKATPSLSKLVRFTQPLAEAVSLGAAAEDFKVSAFIRAAVIEKLKGLQDPRISELVRMHSEILGARYNDARKGRAMPGALYCNQCTLTWIKTLAHDGSCVNCGRKDITNA